LLAAEFLHADAEFMDLGFVAKVTGDRVQDRQYRGDRNAKDREDGGIRDGCHKKRIDRETLGLDDL